MKALSLTQPWATLVATRAKRFETRSWQTSWRGPLAIHAAKGLTGVGGRTGLTDLCQHAPFYRALGGGRVDELVDRLPLGAIIAVANLTVVHRTEDVRHSLGGDHELERAFGDYSDGRYAWRLDGVVALPQPIECKGALSVWDVPDELLVQLHRQLARGLDLAAGKVACRECGCTENSACEDGCYWVEPNLCSTCAGVLV